LLSSYLDQVQTAVDYIENNLNQRLSFEDVAAVLSFSPYHFHRVFKSLVGESVTDYIRLRQLTEAAKELLHTRRRILDIALDYQFGSQAAFARAFKRAFGLTPGQYRRNASPHPLLEKKVLTPEALRHRSLHVTLSPRIVRCQDFWVTGLEYHGANQNGEIPALWAKFLTRIQEVPGKIDTNLRLGVCEVVVPFTEASTFSYLASVLVSKESPVPPGMKKIQVPAQTYAVFTHRGPADTLDYTYRYIHGSWLLQSGYELVAAHDFECYDQRYLPKREDSQLDIYIPVREPG